MVEVGHDPSAFGNPVTSVNHRSNDRRRCFKDLAL